MLINESRTLSCLLNVSKVPPSGSPFLFLKNLSYLGIVDLNCCVISAVQQSDSVIYKYIHIYIFIFVSIMVYHRILKIVPCAI